VKNLLITTVGEYNHYSTWAEGAHDYDLYPIDYRINPTFKYPGIFKTLATNPQLLKYDYYWMPDEDIWATPDMIDELFACMDGFDVWLGQPSVLKAEDSFPSWTQFIHKENIDLIYTSFVEIMCPCFSKTALLQCLPTFNKSISGWGLDLVWGKLGRDKKMAIINSVAIKHTRPVGAGHLYDALSSQRVYPSVERKILMREYGISSIDIRTWI
jgi:hypothetical protein